MTDKQPEALAQMLQPGGIVPIDVETTAMLVGEITRQHAALERKDALLMRALLLCDWLAETPHQRGSINGLAAQLQHAIQQEIEQ